MERRLSKVEKEFLFKSLGGVHLYLDPGTFGTECLGRGMSGTGAGVGFVDLEDAQKTHLAACWRGDRIEGFVVVEQAGSMQVLGLPRVGSCSSWEVVSVEAADAHEEAVNVEVVSEVALSGDEMTQVASEAVVAANEGVGVVQFHMEPCLREELADRRIDVSSTADIETSLLSQGVEAEVEAEAVAVELGNSLEVEHNLDRLRARYTFQYTVVAAEGQIEVGRIDTDWGNAAARLSDVNLDDEARSEMEEELEFVLSREEEDS